MLETFDHYCEYKRTPNGIILAPIQLGKWLVIFCDEINLPDEDKYGTQRIISFIRQCIEHNGFYRSSDQSWIKLECIQFFGACNPPTDPGRKPLSHRLLPLVYVDYPGELSLKQHDLRNVLRRSGTKGEKIVFILDESNVLDSGFLERMKTLLANGEVPVLFEGDEYSTLMTQCKEGAQRDGLMLDSSEELYKWFTNEVMCIELVR
jgi:hypothetical protein